MGPNPIDTVGNCQNFGINHGCGYDDRPPGFTSCLKLSNCFSFNLPSKKALARAFLEGRLNEKQLDSFRQEVKPGGLSSYPHPWLMPKFWQFPTVSMGLGPMLAIYQARYMKYLINRGLIKDEGRKVWAFLGDGEMDEPESMGAIGLAAASPIAPIDSGSSISPSPKKAHTFLPSSLIKPLLIKYFMYLA